MCIESTNHPMLCSLCQKHYYKLLGSLTNILGRTQVSVSTCQCQCLVLCQVWSESTGGGTERQPAAVSRLATDNEVCHDRCPLPREELVLRLKQEVSVLTAEVEKQKDQVQYGVDMAYSCTRTCIYMYIHCTCTCSVYIKFTCTGITCTCMCNFMYTCK